MQCPKCGYNSFDYNDSCPRCHRDLTSVRQELGLLAVRPQPAPFLKTLIGAAAEGGEFTFQGKETERPGADETAAEEAKEALEVEAETLIEAEAEPAVETEVEGIAFEMPAPEARPTLRVARAPAKVEEGPSLELTADEEEPELELTLESEASSLKLAAEEEEPAVTLEQEVAPALEEAATVIMEEPPARPLRVSAVEPPVVSAVEPPVVSAVEPPAEEVSLELGEEPEDLSVEVARVQAELQKEEEKGLDLADFEIKMDEEKKAAPAKLGRESGGETIILEAEKPRAPEPALKVIPLSETMEEELDLSDLKLGPDSEEEDLDLGEIEKLDLSGLDEETEGKEEDFSLSLADVEEEPAAKAAGQDVDISEDKTVILEEAAAAPAPSKTPAAPKKGAGDSDEIELDLTDLKIDD
jgi:hypothetical protein